MNYHLSARDISAWLAGDRTPGQEQHVSECAECRAALTHREGTLAHFGGAVKDWSGQQLGPTRPVVRPVVLQIVERRHGFGMLRLAAAAVLVVLITAVPIHLRHRAVERAAEMARQDETLLQQVQTEVSRSVPQPMESLTALVSWTSDPTK